MGRCLLLSGSVPKFVYLFPNVNGLKREGKGLIHAANQVSVGKGHNRKNDFSPRNRSGLSEGEPETVKARNGLSFCGRGCSAYISNRRGAPCTKLCQSSLLLPREKVDWPVVSMTSTASSKDVHSRVILLCLYNPKAKFFFIDTRATVSHIKQHLNSVR